MFNLFEASTAFSTAAPGRWWVPVAMSVMLAAHVAHAADADQGVLDASMQAVPKKAEMPVPPLLVGGREADLDRADHAGPEFASPGSDRADGGGVDAGPVSIPAVVRLPGR